MQELAADAGRNLDHALPSMDAAMHALQSVSAAEIAELRNMKNPSDLMQQVGLVPSESAKLHVKYILRLSFYKRHVNDFVFPELFL